MQPIFIPSTESDNITSFGGNPEEVMKKLISSRTSKREEFNRSHVPEEKHFRRLWLLPICYRMWSKQVH